MDWTHAGELIPLRYELQAVTCHLTSEHRFPVKVLVLTTEGEEAGLHEAS